jgi:hypothetical protein
VGFLRPGFDGHYKPVLERADRSFDAESVMKAWESMGWERGEMMLF